MRRTVIADHAAEFMSRSPMPQVAVGPVPVGCRWLIGSRQQSLVDMRGMSAWSIPTRQTTPSTGCRGRSVPAHDRSGLNHPALLLLVEQLSGRAAKG